MVGQVKSFNYDLFNQGFTYFNNLDYTICFKKWPGFCTVTFDVPSNSEDLHDLGNAETFLLTDRMSKEANIMDYYDSPQVKNHQERKKIFSSSNIRPIHELTSFNIISRDFGPKNCASVGPLKCPTDYLMMNSLRFCGDYLNEDALYSSNIRTNGQVIDNSTGPIYLRFVTSRDTVGKGFIVNYIFNPCLLSG